MDIKNQIVELSGQIYFFILKKVKNTTQAKDILQNVHLKAFENVHQLKHPEKTRAWLYQIARNEIADYYHQESKYVQKFDTTANEETFPQKLDKGDFCCLDKFIDGLPPIYKSVIEQTYLKGKTQKETAQLENISLANVKARLRRAKHMLQEKLQDCCQYQMDENGKLVGEPNCVSCNAVINGSGSS